MIAERNSSSRSSDAFEEGPAERPRRVIFVDREGASSIWSLMALVARQLENAGWEAGFVAMTDDSGITLQAPQTALGFRRISVPSKRWKGDLLRQQRAFERGFSAILEGVRPDVVHVNFAVPGIWARRVAKRCGVPWVVSTQHELRGSLAGHLRLGLRLTRSCVDVHTYVSETVAASFGHADLRGDECGGALPAHVVIRNGVDAELIRTFRRRPAERVPGRIVAPGRLVPEKGQALLVDALAALKVRHPRAHLIFAGSGPQAERLKALAERRGVAGAVTFEGWLLREALWQLLASAEVAAFASDGSQEGFGLALAEAAVLEVPLVASCIAAFREVLAYDDGAARWFEPGDEGDLARALSAALEASAEVCARRAAQGRHLAETRASVSAMIEGYAALYTRLAGGVSAGANDRRLGLRPL